MRSRFFDLLARSEANFAQLRVEHRAEGHALDLVLVALETKLVEPFKPDYDNLVAKARAELTEKLGV